MKTNKETKPHKQQKPKQTQNLTKPHKPRPTLLLSVNGSNFQGIAIYKNRQNYVGQFLNYS